MIANLDTIEAPPESVGSTIRRLTRSLDSTKEGLAMKATPSTCEPYTDRGSQLQAKADDESRGRWPSQSERLWSKIEPQSPGCWIWTGASRGRYGRTTWDGKRDYVHRIVWSLLVGPIPPGCEIDHLCRVTRCCNPDHLEPVSHAENMRRSPIRRKPGCGSHEREKTHCPSGHIYDEANTGRYPTTGHRYCRACNREKHRKARRIAEAATAAVREALDQEEAS